MRALAPEAVETVEHLLGQERRERLDDRPGGGEIARRALDRRAHRRLRLIAATGLQHQADLQPAQRRRRDPPVERLRRQAGEVARVGPRQRRHHQRRVGHAARQRPGGAAGVGRVDRHAAAAGLEADEPAPAGRQAHRAADVGAQMQRAIAGRGRRGGAGRGAAGIAVEPPWVAGQRVKAGKPRRQHAVVGHRRLGEENRTRFAQPRGRRRVGGGGRQQARGRAERRRLALRGDVLLHRRRHAVERADWRAAPPAILGRSRLGQSPLRRKEIGGANVRFEPGDAPQYAAHRLERRQRARAVGREQRGGAHLIGLHRKRMFPPLSGSPPLRGLGWRGGVSSDLASPPRYPSDVVDEDRRVLPQALQPGVGDGHVGILEQENVDAVLGDLALGVADRRLEGVEVRRRLQRANMSRNVWLSYWK